jgi:hypothetical protein
MNLSSGRLFLPLLASILAYNKYRVVSGTARGARWPRGQCAWRAIAEAKQHSQMSVIGWVTKIYYL